MTQVRATRRDPSSNAANFLTMRGDLAPSTLVAQADPFSATQLAEKNMASDQLRQVSAQIRAQRAQSPVGTGTIAQMRANMEAQQGGLPVPADVDTLDLTVANRPARRVRTPGAREDRGTLYLHGGGYVMGSLNTHQELMGRIARATNAQVLGLDYGLRQSMPIPPRSTTRWLPTSGSLSRALRQTKS